MLDGIERADLHDRIRVLLDGRIAGDAATVDGTVALLVDALSSEGWHVLRSPAAPLRRIVMTLLPNGQPVGTVELTPLTIEGSAP